MSQSIPGSEASGRRLDTPLDVRVSSLKRACAVMLLAGLSSASLACAPAIASQMGREFGYDAARTGWFFSAEFAGFVLSGLAGQWLMPRFRWSRVALMSLLGFLVGTIATTFVLDSFALLLTVRASTATCGALLGVVCMASANEDPNPARAFSYYIIGQLAIGVAGLAVLPLLFARFGFIAFLAVMAVLLVLAARTTSWLAEGKSGPRVGVMRGPARRLAGRWRLLRIPVLLFFYIALGGIWTFSGELAAAAGLDPVLAGNILSVATFAGIVGSGAASILGPNADTRKPVAIGYGLLVASALAFLYSGQATAFVLAVLVFKFAWTFALPFVFAIIGELDTDGRIVAEMYLVAGFGLMLGPSIAGQLVSLGSGFSWMLILETVMVVVSAVCVWVLRQQIASNNART